MGVPDYDNDNSNDDSYDNPLSSNAAQDCTNTRPATVGFEHAGNDAKGRGGTLCTLHKVDIHFYVRQKHIDIHAYLQAAA